MAGYERVGGRKRVAAADDTEAGMEGAKRAIRAALDGNDYAWADIRCRRWIGLRPADPDFHMMLAEIALGIGARSAALRAVSEAARLGATGGVAALRAKIEATPVQPAQEGPRYLLAPEWGYGFWADVGHVLGSILLAEMTGRQPVVHWGNNSLFSPGDSEDAWPLYFEPVGKARREDLVAPGLSYYPPEWTPEAIMSPRDDLVRSARRHGTYGIALLGRTENVVVSDTFLGVPDLHPWIEEASAYYGLPRLEIMRRLAEKYLRLQRPLVDRIDAFAQRHLQGRPWLGVHYRGSDKPAEVGSGFPTIAQYCAWIDAFIAAHPAFGIFLLTDSRPALDEFAARYSGRLLATESLRASSPRGVHYGRHDPVRLAHEVILDTYLATRCDVFVGSGTSNVSIAVEYLKRWPEGTCTLLGLDWRDGRFAPPR